MSLQRVQVPLLLLVLLATFVSDCVAQKVVVNEVMYAPASDEPEWLEILNAGSLDEQLSAYTLTVGGKLVVLPTQAIPPAGFVILTKDTSAFREHRGGSALVVQCALPSLRNSGDTIVIRGPSIDSILYLPSWGGSGGRSLERRAPWLPGASRSSWQTCLDSSGATPGRPNSGLLAHVDLALDSVQWRFNSDTAVIQVHLVNRGTDTVRAYSLRCLSFSGHDSDVAVSLDRDSAIWITSSIPDLPLASTLIRFAVVAAGDERPLNDTISVTVPAGLRSGAVVLNEMMCAPMKPEPEWIELFTVDTNHSVSGFDLVVGKYHCTVATVVFSDSGYSILTSNDSGLASIRGLSLSSVIACALPPLSNSGATILLLDARGTVIDSMTYVAQAVHLGRSLERRDPRRSARLGVAWRPCSDSTGATPLRANSDLIAEHDAAVGAMQLAQDSLRVVVLNEGSRPIPKVTIGVTGDGIEPVSDSTRMTILSYDSVALALPIATLPLGLVQLNVVCSALDDRNASNDSAKLDTRSVIPEHGIVINEIMYQPAVGGTEWIELKNRMDSPISLRGCLLESGDSNRVTKMPVNPVVIPASGYGIVAANSNFITSYPTLTTRAEVSILGRASLSLPDEAGTILLTSFDSASLDSTSYRASWHNPRLKAVQGVSLARRDPSASSTDSTNWTSSSSASGATPLSENFTQGDPTATSAELSVSIDPNPVVPGGSVRPRLTASSSVLTGTWRARLYHQGSLVRTLVDNRLWSGSEAIDFVVEDDDGRQLPPGLYTLLVEVTDEAGATSVKRMGLVVAPSP